MIEIKHADYASINAGELELSGQAINTIYIDENCLWVCATSAGSEITYESNISFYLTKQFIQELKALVMVMENTFEEVDDDSRN